MMQGRPELAFVPPPVERPLLPPWVKGTAIALVAIIGIMWTVHHRRARANDSAGADLTRQMNAINSKGVERLNRIQSEQDRQAAIDARHARAEQERAAARPVDLTDAMIRRLVESCPEFAAATTVRLPKQFRRSDYSYKSRTYPALAAAVRSGFVEFRPPLESTRAEYDQPIEVVLTTSGSVRLRTTDSGSEYIVDLGGRKVDSINSATNRGSFVSIAFSWRYAEDEVAPLAPDQGTRSGGAELSKSGENWSAKRVWIKGRSASTTLCPS